MPYPRKLTYDSARMASATLRVAATTIGAVLFGSKCRRTSRRSEAPPARAASI